MPTAKIGKYVEANLRLGRLLYRSETIVTAVNFQSNFINDPATNTIGTYAMQKTGSSWYYGAGVKVNPMKYVSLSLEYAHAPYLISGKDGVQRGTKTLTAGIIFSYKF